MEYLCEYCEKPFLPKRTDSLYCSHSCRQLAYVLRKATGNRSLQGLHVKPKEVKVMELSNDDSSTDYMSKKENSYLAEVNNLTLNKAYPSIIDDYSSTQLPVKTDKETSVLTDSKRVSMENKLPVNADSDITQIKSELPVRTDIINVNTDKKLTVSTDMENIKTDKKLPVNTDMEMVNTTKSVRQEQEMPEAEFTEYSSRFINELDDIHNERDNWIKLNNFFSNNDAPAIWVSVRYRCLLECLLAFSEMKQIELDDLKEVCNGLTRLIQSRNFKILHPSYPYREEINQLREKVRNTCIKAGEMEWIKYKLSKEQKQFLIVTRLELSQFVPKKKFSELSFSEKQLNRKEE